MFWNEKIVEDIINRAILEDVGMGDVTSENLISSSHTSEGYILAKEDGVLAGLKVAKMVFSKMDESIEFKSIIEDGQEMKKGDRIAKINGPTLSILKGERVALNFLQRMSAIATKTRKYVNLVKDLGVRVTDTRKTTPNLRILEKYAVTVGGGSNHRMGLYDAVMIKDNHIAVVGSIVEAVKKVRASIPHTVKIEIETENFEEVKEAVSAGADIIMLDNMNIELMKKSVEYINGRAIVEASGGITERNIREVAKTGVDVISVGALTTKIDSLDISLEIVG
ncbi:carboxylating nicotinate-nucleotide diphosphorylase [Mesoaciditoga sp.]